MPGDIPISIHGHSDAKPALPALFASTSRAVGAEPGEEFLPPGYLKATASFDVSNAARSIVAPAARPHRARPDELVVLELEDGSTLVTSAARLKEAIERSHPDWLDDDGGVPLEKLRAAGAAPGRGLSEAVGGLVRKVFTFTAG